MPRPRKAASKRPPRVPKSVKPAAEDPVQEDPQKSLYGREVVRRISLIEAICEAESENLLSRLRYMKSYMTEEQLKMPALQFFEEHFPNLEVVRNDEYNALELKWKDDIVCGNGHYGIGENMRASVAPSTGLPFSVDSVRKSVFGDVGMTASKLVGAAFQTPGAMASRLSFGMTPRTVRLPKNGEMLLSVRGSPLGVYKEDNLGSISTIHESADGSVSCGS